MTLICIIVALLLESIRPLNHSLWVERPADVLLDLLEERFNSGAFRDGVTAWTTLIILAIVCILLIGAFLNWLFPAFYYLFSIAVLYWSLGFSRYHGYFNEIAYSLQCGDTAGARSILAGWRGMPGKYLSMEEIARLSIEHGLIAAYRNLFAILILYALLGPAAAVAYRMSILAHERWIRSSTTDPTSHFAEFAGRALYIIDWIPARITALLFTFVGNFEDALFCWRSQASTWPNHEEGIILASGAGAMGVRLGRTLIDEDEATPRPELGLGSETGFDTMRAATVLVWYALLLWLALLFLTQLAAL